MSALHLKKCQRLVPLKNSEFLFILEGSSSMFWFHYGVGILIYQPDGLLVCISYRMILRVFGGAPCPPYIVWGAGLQVG